MVAGIAAWQRRPASWLGLLFTIVGYLYLVPYILVNLANPVAWTIGNVTEGVYGAALAHLGLAWPTGRLRSRFERGVSRRRLRAEHRVQHGRDDVLESLVQRLQRQPPGQRAASSAMVPGSAWNTLDTIEGSSGS